MRKKLKKYRKSKGFSKKQIARKLGISTKEYKEIEKGAKINDKLKKKIKALLKKKPRRKTAEIKLPTGIADISKSINRITTITSPAQEIMNKINAPLNQTLSLQNITNAYKPNTTALDYLKDTDNKQSIGWSTLDSVSKLSIPIKEATNNQLKAYKGFQSIFDNQPNSLTSAIEMQESLLASITKPTDSLKTITDSSFFQSITETVIKNKAAYENYIGFSSELTKTLSNSAISSSIYPNIISAENFIKNKPSVLDFLSGNTFTVVNDDDFDDELDIITQIENNPEYKEEADNIFNEFQQIVNDEELEEVNEQKVEQIYEKFYLWIIKTFSINRAKAKKIAKRILLILPTIVAVISFTSVQINKIENEKAHEKTQKELQEVKSILNNRNAKENEDKEKQLEINQKILNRINSESSQNMIAIQDVNLRSGRSAKSKIKAVITTSQKVIVLDKKVKWMEVIYVDTKDKKSRTGWARIEYFK